MTGIETRSITWRATCASIVALALLGACGEKKKEATSAAAKVNGEEVTVQQINNVLLSRNLRPDQTDAAARQVLERLIDQQLALQKAAETKLDKDPRVVAILEAARRDALARAYLETIGDKVPKATPDEVKKYFDDNPAMFTERRIYNFQEFQIEARPEQHAELRDRLTAAKNINEFVEFLRAGNFRFAVSQAVRAADQFPKPSLELISKLRDGQWSMQSATQGVQVVLLLGSIPQPVTLDQVRPQIEQHLFNERKRKRMDDELKELRKGAKVEYLGKFAEGKPGTEPAASAPK